MSNPTASNILKTKATVWVAPLGEALPAVGLAAGAAWGGNWFRIGFTGAPLKLTLDDERMLIEVEEILADGIDEWITREKASLETELSEVTAEYIQLGKGGTIAVVNQASGVPGSETLHIGNNARLTKYAVGFEGVRWDDDDNALPIRVFHYRTTFKINGATEFSQKTDSYTKLPIMMKVLADPTLGYHTSWRRVTAPALP